MRIPVLFGSLQGEPDTAWLVENVADSPGLGYTEHFNLPPAKFGHFHGCNCCTPSGPAADALTRLFRARATGAAPFFMRLIVCASPAGEVAVRQAITNDVMSAARYRLAGGEEPGQPISA